MNKNKDLVWFSQRGDKFLNSFIRRLVKKDNRLYGLSCALQSNRFISNFDCPWQFKQKEYHTYKTKGDMVEAWIWFLRINYGPEYAKRYILKQIEITLPNFYSGFQINFNNNHERI